MKSEKCKVPNAFSITFFSLLILSLSGCGGDEVTSIVVEGPPSVPMGVGVSITSPNTLTISWNAVANATSYNIYWSNTQGVSKMSAKISGTSSTSYTHNGLISGNTYYYVVTAVNSFGESGASAEVYSLLGAARPPAAVAVVAGNGQTTLSWNLNGATSYNVYMASQSGVTKSSTTLPGWVAYNNIISPQTITGLTNGTTYFFVVTGVNSSGESGESSEVSVNPAPNSSLAVSGYVKYEDKEYGAGSVGFTGMTTPKPVRYAVVEAVESANGMPIATGTTDAAGFYNLPIPPGDSGKSIYIRAISSATSPGSAITPLVAVKDLSNVYHAAAGSNFTVTGAAMANLSIPTTSPVAGAFNILDVYTSGAQFVQSVSAGGGYPPALSAFWQTGNSNGTYFCVAGSGCGAEGIYIMNFAGDTDEYDDDVLWHEYGHFIANRYSKDDSPGGAHYLTSNDLDLRLAWSEGWGDFFPGAIKTWLSATAPALLSTASGMSPTIYVDTLNGGGLSFNFGNPIGVSSLYSSNEVAVAKLLLDLRAAYTMQNVWDVFSSNYVRTSSAPVNLEVFWEGWNSLGKPGITFNLSARSINYFVDTYEALNENAPNSSRKATVGQAESHTLFGSQDVDYIAFDAMASTQYTVNTMLLRNGADTVIRIIAPDATTTITSNDNAGGGNYANSLPCTPDFFTGECHANGNDVLGSRASFTATSTGTYYIEVKSSPNRPLSAGKYGDYSLTITSP